MGSEMCIRDRNIPLPINFETKESKSYQQSFLTQHREKTLIVKGEDIALFSIQNEMVYLYKFDGKKLPLFKKLDFIETVCDPYQFFRINRQMLVNRKAIVSFEPYFNRKIVIELQISTAEKVIVSRLKVTKFKAWLKK